jgi:chromosome segregation ATPase
MESNTSPELAPSSVTNAKMSKAVIMQQAILNELKNDLALTKQNNDSYLLKNKSLTDKLSEQTDQIAKLISEKEELLNPQNELLTTINSLKQQNKDINDQLQSTLEINKELSSLNSQLATQSKHQEDQLNEYKSQLSKLTSEQQHDTEQNNIRENNIIQLKDNEILKLKMLLQDKENEINELTTQLSFIQTEHTKRTHETQSKMAYTFQNLKNSTIENDQLRYMLNEQQKNNDTQYDEIAKLKNTIHSLENTNLTLKKENDTMKSINKHLKESVNSLTKHKTQLNDEYHSLLTTKNNLSKEMFQQQNQFNNELATKKEEYTQLQQMNITLSYKIDDLNRKYQKVCNDNILKSEAIANAEERERRIRKEFQELKNNNTELNKALEKHLSDLKREVHTSYDINTKNNSLTLKINELNIENTNLKKEKNSLEEIYNSFIKEIEILQTNIKDKEIKLYSLQIESSKIDNNINQCIELILNFISKFDNAISEQLQKSYFESFIEFTSSSPSHEHILHNYTRNQKLQYIETFLHTIFDEAEILYQVFISNSNNNCNW